MNELTCPTCRRMVLDGATIHAERIYDDACLYGLLEITPQTLSKARSSGQLKYVRIGKRTLYFGDWITGWLRNQEQLGKE